jgi:hypothetical protein
LANDLISKGFDEKQISIGLSSMDAYENKRTGTALLSIFESIDKIEQHKGKVSYDKAYVLIDKFSEAFSLDHLLVQTPKKDDDAYRYYCKKEGSAETLVLKTGHDFSDNIVDCQRRN